MKKETIVGLIAVVAIVVAVIFAGCVEEETPTPTPVPTSTLAPSPTATPTPTLTATSTPTPTPLPEPKYVAGDIIADEQTNKDCLMTIISYDKDTDEYETNYIFRNKDGDWGHFLNDDTEWYDREFTEEYEPTLIAHVDLSTITIGEPKVSPTPTPTPKSKKWHSVTSFSGSSDKTTQSFTIKGDEWRVEYTVKSSSEYGAITIKVYPRGETTMFIADWDCWEAPCSGTEYIYKGNGEYYFKVGAANLDSWKLEVEDYY